MNNKNKPLKKIKKVIFNRKNIAKFIVIVSSLALIASSFLPYILI